MAKREEWNESLFGCFDDWTICCYGYCCTPCLFGKNAKKIDDSNCLLMCCAYSCLSSCYLCWVPHYFKRNILRENYNLREDSTCTDCGAILCCGPCAICQEARELKSRSNDQRSYRVRGVPNSSSPVTSEPKNMQLSDLQTNTRHF